MGKRLNKKIRKQTLELLNQLKVSNKLSNRSYEAFRNNIETSRIDVVKRLKQNFNVIKLTDKAFTFTKSSLKADVETIKQSKKEKIAKLIPAIKKKYNDISLVKDFNEKRKKTKIDNIT
jgi:3-dehydroquinate dehydratase